MFILASSICKSLQCLISTLTQGGKGGHLFRLSCSIVLWGGRETANKYHWHVWGVLTVYGPHWVCPNSKWCVLPGSMLLRLQGACRDTVQSGPWNLCTSRSKLFRFPGTPQGHIPGRAALFVPFPGSRSPGDWVLGKCALPGGPCVLITSLIRPLGFPVHRESTISGVLCVFSAELISSCDPGCQPYRIPGRRG